MSKSKLKLTSAQKEAIKKVCEYVDSREDNRRWITIDGKAGVGKTTVIIEILKKYYGSKRIVAGAISHKAKSVIREKFAEYSGRSVNNIKFCSVASMLGMKLNEETGEFEYGYSESIPITDADLVIIDECSMISGTQLQTILDMAPIHSKIIFSGDLGQLPPIGNKEVDETSPTFLIDNKISLHQRLRQSEDSPILPYSDYYWNSVMRGEDFVKDAPAEDDVKDGNGIMFLSKQAVINNTSQVFKRAVETGNINLIKYVCYRNVTRTMMNAFLRNYIFGSGADEFVSGDFIIMMNAYAKSDEGGNQYDSVENSMEYIVKSAKKVVWTFDEEEFDVWLLSVDGLNIDLPVIAHDNRDEFDAFISNKFKNAFKIKDKLERKRALTHVWSLKNSVAQVDYSYAITSHKSQGSTYDAVIVDKVDIMNNPLVSTLTKYRSMYTAITRASKLCIIVK